MTAVAATADNAAWRSADLPLGFALSVCAFDRLHRPRILPLLPVPAGFASRLVEFPVVWIAEDDDLPLAVGVRSADDARGDSFSSLGYGVDQVARSEGHV